MSIENSEGDAYGTEEDNIPAEVLEVMGKSGIGDSDAVSKETDTDDTEVVETETETKEVETTETETKETETTETEVGAETTETTETETKETKAEETEPIPQDQVNIARRRGWSDEKIVKIAEEHPEILEDMVALAGLQATQPQVEQKVETAPTKKQEVKEVGKVELDGEALKNMKEKYGDDVVDSVILPLMGGLNNTIDQLNTLRGNVDGVEQTNQANQAKKEFDEANTVFDGLTETFKVFGKTDELPKLSDGSFNKQSPAVIARSELFDIANAFKTSGMNWTDSLKNAVRWYKGEHAEKSLERKVVKDLISRKKKFSPRPTNKKTKQTFVSREAEGEALVRKAYK